MPIKRLIIFCFQIVAMAALLAFAPDSLAGADDDDSAYRNSCNNPANANLTRCLPQNRPNTISIPYRYRKTPPDVGFRYHDNDDDGNGGSVWIPGLTDNMNQESKNVYFEIKRKTSGVVWNYQRKDVAGMIQYVQDNPRTKCSSNINSTATSVALVCKTPGKQNKVFPNMVASQYDQYFDDNMITPVEEFETAHQQRSTGANQSDAPQHTGGARTDVDNSQYEAPTAASRTFGSSGGRNSGSVPSNSGVNSGSAASSAYSSYISSQVAPSNSYANRPVDPIFAATPNAGDGVTTIEEQKLKDSDESAGTSAAAALKEGSTQNSSTTFGGSNGSSVGRAPASAPQAAGFNPTNTAPTNP